MATKKKATATSCAAPVRHGDLVIYPTPRTAVKGLKPIAGNALATGSATGHTHKFLPARNGRQYDLGNGTRLLRVTAPVRLVHEEHKDAKLAAGDYAVGGKRQYDRENGWTNVVD